MKKLGGAAILVFGSLAALPCAAQSLRVEGTEFVLREANGHERRSADLVGAELALPGGMELRIEAVQKEIAPGGGAVWLHTMTLHQPDGSWAEACEADPKGGRYGFPLAGRFDPVNGLVADAGHFNLTCTAGGEGKCVRFGYPPWGKAADGSSLLPQFNACVHMLRADYCGDGTATTRNGTLIDLYDRVGIQQPEYIEGQHFEAGWSPHGAVCISHVRIPENIDFERLRHDCPRLAAVPLGEECSEARAAALGAVLFNRSFDTAKPSDATR